MSIESQLRETIEGFSEDYKAANRRLDILEKDVSQYRKLAEGNGAADAALAADPESKLVFGDFCRMAWAKKTGSTAQPVTKAAADMTIDDDARGGYLTSTTVANVVDAEFRLGGDLISMCSWAQVEPGHTHRIPYFSAAPTAAWQQSEGGAITEMDVQINGLERKPYAIGGYVDVSHQLMHSSSHNFVQTFQAEMLHAIRERLAYSLIRGDDTDTEPYDGLLVMDGTNDLTDLATPSPANVSGFISEAIEANSSLYETGVLVMSPAGAEALMQADATSSYTSRVRWDMGRRYFDRWPIVVEPAMYDSGTASHDIAFISPKHVHVVRYGYTVLVDDKSQVKTLLNTIAAVGWFGYGCSYPGAVCKADLTALA